MRAVSRRRAQPAEPRRARVSGIALLVAASAALVVVPALPASAHNYLVSSAPAAGAVVTEQPGTVSLETNDDLLEVEDGAVIQVHGPDGRFYSDGCTSVAGPSAETQVVLGAPGEYTVAWKVVSTDGHPISGTWAFTWQPAEGVELGDGSEEPARVRWWQRRRRRGQHARAVDRRVERGVGCRGDLVAARRTVDRRRRAPGRHRRHRHLARGASPDLRMIRLTRRGRSLHSTGELEPRIPRPRRGPLGSRRAPAAA